MNYYCPHSGCGAKITYESIKPAACPKCKGSFVNAFQSVTKAASEFNRASISPPLVGSPSNDSPYDEEPVLSPARASMVKRTRGAANPQYRRQYYDENGNPVEVERGGSDGSEDSFDPREVKRLARQLAASISPDDLVILSRPEPPVRFQDWCMRPRDGGQI